MSQEEFITNLLNQNKIDYKVDTSEKNFELKHCPNCKNEKFNFSVHKAKGVFKCWACKCSGGPKELRRILGVKTDSRQVEINVSFDNHATKAHNKIFFRQEALQYMRARGFNEESIRHFKIGCQKKQNRLFITIPHIADNRVVNIKFRAMDEKQPKWLQNRGSTKILFNQDVITQSKEIILTEGELKAIALHQMGFKNVIALTGGVGSFRPEWIAMLKGSRRIYLVMDSDGPGQDGAVRIAKLLGPNRCYNVVLQDAKDPDEYFFDRKHSKSDFKKLLDEAQSISPDLCFKGLMSADKIERESVEHIWHPFVPRSKLVLLDGDPGVGKSTFTDALVAAVSRGENPWPPTLGLNLETNNVLIFCAEDGAGDTIKPRLEAHRAELSNVHIFDGLIKFDDVGLPEIEAMIKSCQPCLVIFDTLQHYLGGKIDLHRANEMREPLAKLGEIAKRNHCSILLIRHLRKSSNDQALYRGLGSIDTAGVARSIMLIARHPSESDLRVLLHIKSNLTKEGRPLCFRLKDGALEWVGRCDLEPEDVLNPNREDDQRQLQNAKEFLTRELGMGSVDSQSLKQKAKQEGIPERTLERAKSILGIKSRRMSKASGKGGGHYHWYMGELNFGIAEPDDNGVMQ